jgi:hypothetical protein
MRSFFKFWRSRKTARPKMSGLRRWKRLFVNALEDRTLLTAVTSVLPVQGLIDVNATNPIKATFDVNLNAATVSGSTFKLTDSAGHAVAATVSYSATSDTAILTPQSPLAYTANYTATLVGGAGGIADTHGTVLPSNFTWSFTTAAAPAVAGQWSQPIDWGLVALHMSLLPTGKVLWWSGDYNGGVTATVWDPATNTLKSVPDNIDNIFCSGSSFLPDGRLMVVGGYGGSTANQGLAIADIFDPTTMTWSRAANMAFGRWYATATTLPNGQIMATSGSDVNETTYVTTPEVYNAATNTWTEWTQAQTSFGMPNYPYMFVLPNGNILNAGADEINGVTGTNSPTMLLNLQTQTWTTVDPNPVDGGSAVQYAPGMIMKSGTSYSETNNNGFPSSPTTFVLNMNQPNPQWQQTQSMQFPRAFHNLTILPTGQVLATGGETFTDGVNLADAVYPSELWNPSTQTWTTMASLQDPRLYHSTALLLPDGRVIVAGGGEDFGLEQANITTAEIYSPSYLFNGPRPTISSSPGLLQYNSSFFVGTPDAANIASVALVGIGSDTHGVNFDQRYVPLSFQQASGGLTVQAPVDANLATPGYYMLFIVNKQGVPSVAAFEHFNVPTVGAITPVRGSGSIQASAPVTVTFNQPMTASTVNASTVELLNPQGAPVPATVSYNATTNVATLTPQSLLLSSNSYTITVAGGTGGVQDANGNTMAANFVSWFTTAALVASVAPTPATLNANPNMNVTATFSEAIDPATLTAATFQLTDTSGHVIPASVRYDATNNTAILIPNAPLATGTTYTATLVGGSSGAVIKDAADNPLTASYTWSFTTRVPAPNPIVAENQLPGTPRTVWDAINYGTNPGPGGDDNLVGYTDNISYNIGQTVNFKIDTISHQYRIDIYRLGYYGGNGAALKASIDVSLASAQVQPGVITDDSTGLIDYGAWNVSASWQIPTTAVSGVYLADLVGEDGLTTESQVVFVVRNDASTSDILYQTADETWQAYNTFGGNSLYVGNGPGGPYGVTSGAEGAAGRAYAVSYNRPMNDRGAVGDTDQLFWAEYPMIYWLEQNGYNVSYFTGIDAARYGSLIDQHQVYLAAGHDEYWSGPQRANVTAAEDAGVNLAFFSGNEDYWKTRLGDAIDGSYTADRTLVCYKETLGNDGIHSAKIDPLPDVWTGTWADPSFSPPADGNQPANELGGTIFTVNRGPDFPGDPIQVPYVDSQDMIWANTAVAALQPGGVYTSAPNILGYEWDSDLNNGFRPAGLIDLSSVTYSVPQLLLNYGSTFGPGTATNSQTLYRADSGAFVFSAGTVQWSWGLANVHDGGSSPTDPVIQQATVNVLAMMGVQPSTLQVGLVAGRASSDRTPPTSRITSSFINSIVQTTVTYTIVGTAVDAGGGVVAGVEVSVDGGHTWQPATGHSSWSFTWTPTTPGTATIECRAVDDSGNLEVPSSIIQVSVLPTQTTPPQIANVSARVLSTTSATIGWITDKPGTSSVSYGTSPTALTSVTSSGTLVTTHSITLAGLSPGTTYYYTVSSTDSYGNTQTVPGSGSAPDYVVMPPFLDNTPALFGQGTTDANTYVSTVGGGAVILNPTLGVDFNGTALPAGWTANPYGTGSSATVANGVLTVDGALVGASTLYSPGRSLEFTATFSGQAFQAAGLGVDLKSSPWAIFSTGSGGTLYAETDNGNTSDKTALGSNWLGSAHVFRIDWSTTAVTYSIDGTIAASDNFGITTGMKPVASDLTPGGGALAVQYFHMTPNAASGTFLSRVADGGQAVTWRGISWVTFTPTGTSAAIYVRMGNTPTPDGTWTAWVPIAASGNNIGGVARYAQYRADLATTTPAQTPELLSVSIGYDLNADTIAPTIVAESPAPNAVGADYAAPITVSFSELMNPATINSSTVYLQQVGTSTNMPATVTYSGSTAVLQPVGILNGNKQYQVTVSAGVTDVSGNALGSNQTWTFTTRVLSFTDQSVSDFSGGTPGANTVVSGTAGGAEVSLSAAAGLALTGTSLPAGWTSSPWGAGGAATVSGGLLTVDGTLVGTSTYYGPARSLDAIATLSNEPYEHVGFATDTSNAPWAIFSVGSGGALYAQTNNGNTSNSTLIAGSWLGSPHHFHIDWTSTSVAYSIDGTVVATDNIGIAANMRPIVSDFTPGGGAVVVSYLQVSPYVATGSYLSRVFNAGQAVTWSGASWAASTPAGTSVALLVRMGNTPTPDSGWTSFVPLSASGATIGGVSQYLQYEAVLATTSQNITPALDSVTITYTKDPDTVAPTVVAESPAPGTTNANYAAPITVNFSELMNPATISGATVYLQQMGSTTTVPATVTYAGSTATIQPTAILNGNTQYQVTVAGSVADVSGNTLGSNLTWTFTTRVLSFSDSAVSDFASGTTGANTYVTTVPGGSGGQVNLTPVVGLDLSGSSLPAGWTSSPWATSGTATVGGGLLTVDGTLAATSAFFGPSRSLDVVATFSSDPYEHVGLATDTNSAPWAIFSVGGGGALYAQTSNGTTSNSTLIAGNWLNAPHRFHIDWMATSVTYSIDGTVVATDNIGITASMRPIVSDLDVGGGSLVVSYIQMTPYASMGSYLSRVFNAGQAVTWSNATWTAATPAGTSVALLVRMGGTPTPDSSWTSFVPLSGSGATIGGVSQYLQYEANLATTVQNQTPALQGVTINYTTAPDTVTPTIVAQTPAPGATNVDIGAPISVTFSELMNPATMSTSSVHLRAAGSTADVPATVSYVGSTAVLQPTNPLPGGTTFQVTLDGTVTDSSGNALTATTWSFATALATVTDTTAADFNAGTVGTGLYVSQMGNGEVILAPTLGADFVGTALPSGWSGMPWSAGGAATVGGGLLTVDGSLVTTATQYAPGGSLEFVGTFSGDAFQAAGLGVNLNAAPWAIFGIKADGQLYARTNNGTTANDTLVTGIPNLLNAPHDFRINWTSTSVTYSIDGTVVATDNIGITANMNPVISDIDVGGGAVTVKWMHLTPYATSGTFLSRVIDAGGPAAWNTLSWDSVTPANTGVAISVRLGNTPTPDASWTPFTALTGSGAAIGGGLYEFMQYSAALSTADPGQTPVLQDVTATFAIDPPTTTSGSVTTNENAPIGGTLSATSALGKPLTYVLTSSPAHGTVTVDPSTGNFSYTPALYFAGTDSFRFAATDGSHTSLPATETVTVNPVNQPPSFTPGSDQTVLENSGPQTITAWATHISPGPANEVSQSVNFGVSDNNPTLFAVQPTIDANGNLSYTPAANASGSAVVTVQAHDNGGTANGGQDTAAAQTFNINVLFVNQPPSFSKGPDQSVLVNSGLQTVSSWASGISAGPANEANLSVHFLVGDDNPALFSQQPSIDANGNLFYTPAANATGTTTVTVRLQNSGGTATGGQDTSGPQTFTITVNPLPAATLVVTGLPTSTTAAETEVFTVEAEDTNGNPAAGYRGTVHFSSSDLAAGLPADYTFTAADAGVRSFTVTFMTPGTQSVTASDAANALSGSQTGVSVAAAAAATSLVVSGFPNPIVSWVDGFVTVTAHDAFGNVATGYHGTVHFSSSDLQAGLPADYTFTAGDKGAHTFDVILDTAGTQSITVSDAADGLSGSQAGIVVVPGPVAAFGVTAFPGTTAGTSQNFVVTAYDAWGNVATNYTGTIHFTSSDLQAGLPADYTFTANDNGKHTFAATLDTAGQQRVTATDTVTTTAFGSEVGINVSPASPASVSVSGGSGQSATVANAFAAPLVVTVTDQYGNPVPGVSVAFAAPASGATATLANASVTTGANGQAGDSATAGTVTGPYTASASVSGLTTPASFTLTNNAGPASSVSVTSGGGQSATVANAFAAPLVVSVTDQYGNPVPGVSVAFAAPASGATATLANSSVTTEANGQAGDSATAGTVAGSYTVSASVSGLTTPASFTLTNDSGAASSVSVTGGDGQSATVANAFANALVATVTDKYGNPVPGVSVAFAAPTSGATATLANSSVTTGANGQAGDSATAGTVAGSYTVSASVSGLTRPASFTLTNNPGAASSVSVTSGGGQSATVANAFAAPLVVTVLDAYGNAVPGVSVAFAAPASGATATLANATVTTGGNGQASDTATAGTVAGSYAVTASVSGVATPASFTLRNTPGAAATLSVSAPTSTTAGAAFTITLTALDAYGNVANGYAGTVHFTSSDPQAVLPADYTFTTTDAGHHKFTTTKSGTQTIPSFVLKTAGSQSVTATDTVTATITASQSGIVVSPAAAKKIAVTGFPQTTTAGSAGSVTLTMLDGYGNVATGYTGTVHFKSSDAKAVLPANYTFTATDAGVHTFTGVALKTAGSQSITATDTVTGTITGSETAITVNSAAAARYTVAAVTSTVAGSSFSLTVTAFDAYGNVATGYTGTIHFASGDVQAVLPGNYTFTATDAGVHTFTGVALKTAGSRTVAATDIATSTVTGSATVTVTPAAASSIRATAVGSTTAGSSFSVTLTVLDAYGNVATGYTGTVRFTSGDAKAVLPADYTFTATDAGVHTFTGVVLKTAGSQSITATDTVTGTITGKATVSVTAAAAATYSVTSVANSTAGSSFSVTVTALDAYGNVATGYQGAAHFTSTDGQAVLPANYTFTATDAGKHTFTGVVLKTAGSQSITATGTGTGTITGQTAVSVKAAAAKKLVIIAPSSVTSGVAFTFTIEAVDAYGNIATGYLGAIGFTSTDRKAGLPARYTFTSGDNGVHTFTATLRTKGTQSITATDANTGTITGTLTVTVN